MVSSFSLTVNVSKLTSPPHGAPTGTNFVGVYFSIEANVTTHGLTLTFYYTDEAVQAAGVSETSLAVYYWDETTGQWVRLPSVVNTEQNTVTVQVTHLSYFAIIGTASAPFEATMILLLLLNIQAMNPLPIAAAIGIAEGVALAYAVWALRRKT